MILCPNIDDLKDSIITCPLRNSEYMSCNLKPRLRCPQSNQVGDVECFEYDYQIPDECPLRKEDVVVKMPKAGDGE